MEKQKITDLYGRVIFDSNSEPAFEITLVLNNNSYGYGYAPKGSTQGGYECNQLYGSNDKEVKDIMNILLEKTKDIKKHLLNVSIASIYELDDLILKLDGTDNKSNLPGNLTLAISTAGFYALSHSLNVKPFKLLEQNSDTSGKTSFMFNLVDGIKKSPTSGLECLLIPKLMDSWEEIILKSNKIFATFEKLFIARFNSQPHISKQGGFCSERFIEINDMLELSCTAIEKSGFVLGKDFSLGLDIAATELYQHSQYLTAWNQNQYLSTSDLLNFYQVLMNKYPLEYIEDGFSDTDFDGWIKLSDLSAGSIMISGDDLFATNLGRLNDYKACANTVVIKPNQIGTISETISFIDKAKHYDMTTVISQRTSEIEYNLISHLAYACNIDYLKAGGLKRMERISRYNELIRLKN